MRDWPTLEDRSPDKHRPSVISHGNLKTLSLMFDKIYFPYYCTPGPLEERPPACLTFGIREIDDRILLRHSSRLATISENPHPPEENPNPLELIRSVARSRQSLADLAVLLAAEEYWRRGFRRVIPIFSTLQQAAIETASYPDLVEATTIQGFPILDEENISWSDIVRFREETSFLPFKTAFWDCFHDTYDIFEDFSSFTNSLVAAQRHLQSKGWRLLALKGLRLIPLPKIGVMETIVDSALRGVASELKNVVLKRWPECIFLIMIDNYFPGEKDV